MKRLQIFFLVAVVFTFSCTSYKQVPYFQDVRRDSTIREKINYSPITMQPGDLIGLKVTSLNSEADAIFNNNSTDRLEQNAVVGYLVDDDGNINVPIIGIVKVAGFSTKDISTQLETKLLTYLSKPVVNVRILNFKISVLGDVNRPGSYSVENEKITLTEALSLAGDLNTTALRKNVLLIREKDGNRTYINIDLTSKDIFNSPSYYLQNNDVIYAQPNEARVQNDAAASLTRVGIFVSAFASVLYAITLYITRN